MTTSFFRFLSQTLSANNGDPSSTRVALLLVVLTLCLFVFTVSVVTLLHGTVPEIPPGTGLFLGGLITVMATLKGAQNKEENKKEEPK
jgi:uncharacterized BrkB/YihY/UPF0761 family membrane protein